VDGHHSFGRLSVDDRIGNRVAIVPGMMVLAALLVFGFRNPLGVAVPRQRAGGCEFALQPDLTFLLLGLLRIRSRNFDRAISSH
jgi:hypothetical protein